MELLSILNKNSGSTLNIPKLSIETFELKNNYFVVSNGTVFNYYAITVYPSDDSSPLIRINKAPPVLLEGVAIIDKKVYFVSLEDIFRRVVRKSREIIQEVNDGSSERNTTTFGSSGTTIEGISNNRNESISGGAISSTDELGLNSAHTMEVGTAAYDAWSEQIGTLLDTLSKKEGEDWEISDSA